MGISGSKVISADENWGLEKVKLEEKISGSALGPRS